MSLGRGLTPIELELVLLIAVEVREHGKESSQSYLAMLPAWREIVDAVLSVDSLDEESDDASEADARG